MKALVTGASRGIGQAIAKALADEGYELYLTCDRTFEVLKQISDSIHDQYGVSVHPYEVDMSDERSVNALFDEIGDIDLVVNNAGISYAGLLTDMTSAEWHRVMAVNVDSCFYTSKAALKSMVRNHRGRIINISSIWGNVGASMEVAYSASKGAVNSFTKALAKEVAPSNIQVNAIACGVINTSMNSCFTEEEMKELIDDIPADRIGEPDEIGKAVCMLAKAPEYLTGQIITIDGGYI